MRLFGIGFIAFIVLVIFGKIYMAVTRPVAPLPVAKTLEYYASGVKLGEPVSSAKSSVASLRFVSHLGFVGANTARGEGSRVFPQVRLLLAPSWRVKTAKAAADAPIDAVELVTANKYAFSWIAPQITQTFMSAPRVGCIRTSTPGNFREVHYWTTKNNLGGAALINDWGGSSEPAHPGQMVVNLILYSGPFDGSRTLRSKFVPIDCARMPASS
jgi:hypothetical protein